MSKSKKKSPLERLREESPKLPKSETRAIWFHLVSVMQLPHVKLTAAATPKVQQPLTAGNLERVLQLADVRLRFNLMTSEIEFSGPGVTENGMNQQEVRASLQDTLSMIDINNHSRLDELLRTLASRHEYHPMAEWIESKPWDGVDRLADLAATVPTDSELWPVYLRKWLIQAIEATFGWQSGHPPQSLPHVPTFCGAQGAGKGRWIRSLAGDQFVNADVSLHLGGFAEKDSMLAALDKPVAELGEIDSTFSQSAMSALKAFLSRQVDTIRRPYAREADKRRRMTAFIGSVNRAEFLIDGSGSRRFWPVEIRPGEKLNYRHGIDTQQLFAQVLTYWESGESWNLSEAEDAKRIADSMQFTEVPAIAELADGHWIKHRDDTRHYAVLNRTEIAKTFNGSTHPHQLRLLGEWLESRLGKMRKINGKKRCWPWPAGAAATGLLTFEFVDEKDAKNYVAEAQRRSPWGLKIVGKNE